MNILIAEDQTHDALFLRRILERLGHQVTVATDGCQALILARAERFPLIIIDWMMPGLDGLELCRMIRQYKGLSYTYLILITLKQGHQERLEGLRAGADDFLVKPADAEELTIRLEIAQRILSVQEELERRNAQLAELASSDALTGVKNRRRFFEIVNKHVSRSDRRDSYLSLIIIDVDHFKSYNDEFGHPAGDLALRAVGKTLLEGIRENDTLGRIGGEEFAILLPETNAEIARELAERLRLLIVSQEWPLRPLTASFGVVTRWRRDATIDQLFEKADRALYQSKNRGRNCVTHSSDL